MRLADIVLDLAAVLNASRSVASKHAALRAQQLDRFNKTSSIAAAVRQRKPAAVPSSKREESVATQDRNGSTSSPTAEQPSGTTFNRQPLSNNTEQADDEAPPELSSFASRPKNAPLKNALYDLRRKEYQSGDELGSPATASSKPHPLDPRFKQQSNAEIYREAVPESYEKEGGNIPDGVDINVVRSSRIARLLGLPTESSAADKTLTRVSHIDRTTSERFPVAQASPESGIEQAVAEDPSGRTSTHRSNEVHEGSTAPQDTNGTAISRVTLHEENPSRPEEIEVQTPPALSTGSQPAKVQTPPKAMADVAAPAYQLRESRVPSSRMSRLWNYGGLAAGMLGGALSESISRGFGGGGQGSVMLSSANMERLVAKLSRMRGAALKLGQMMSFQDSKMLPGPIQEVLQRVQDRADYMPSWQRDKVLVQNLGSEWRELFDEFEEKPIAAASIGQVHRAILKSSGARVAVKIQFPGVADSINSDLDNLAVLLAATKLLPKGLYLNKTIDNARTELAWECDYEREAECARRYGELLAEEEDVFLVPRIYPEASGKQVLTMEYMNGTAVTRVTTFSQEQRDWIGTQILRLCLKEITEFRFMQTDPNWTNFLYNPLTGKLELLDFGASRDYPERFISLYVRLLYAASKSDKESVRTLSQELGYLTGHESKAMVDAHTQSVLTLAEPFLDVAPELYDFSDQTITERVKALIPVMVRERLAPPPEETYSLHRKLSGAFLLCAKLGSQVRCRQLFEDSLRKTNLTMEADLNKGL
jgi:aarF domain-containing kinase